MHLSRRTVLTAAAAMAAAPAAAARQMVPAERPLQGQGRYLARWIEMLDEPGERARLLAMLGADQAEHIDWVMRDTVTQYAAFLGDEASALKGAGQSVSTPDPGSDLEAIDALEATVGASRGHRVVVLNEAHVASRHRALLGRLIPLLRAEGFTHLAAETFDDSIATLAPGQPLSFRHGWYIADPVYAEAVRLARELGYGLIPYEQRDRPRLTI